MKKVRCIMEGTLFLTKGNIYEAIAENKIMLCIKKNDADCHKCWYYKENFETLNKKQPQTYQSWEIVKMIQEGKLKDDNIIIDKYNKEYKVKDIKNGNYGTDFFFGDKDDIFTIKKQPTYVTFDEARRSDKKIRYRNMNEFYTLHEIISDLSSDIYDNKIINELMDEKAWEIEDNN